MVYSIYETVFTNFNMGYASAKAIILFIIIMVITDIIIHSIDKGSTSEEG